MKVKLFLAFMLCSLSIGLKAQETKSSCNFEYKINAEKNPEGLNYKDRFVNFNWDISKIAPNDSISIEIVKIYDCFIGLDGTQTQEYKILNLKSKDLLGKNSFKIMHADMVAKCFKWRVIMNSSTCLEQTDWNYYNYID